MGFLHNITQTTHKQIQDIHRFEANNLMQENTETFVIPLDKLQNSLWKTQGFAYGRNVYFCLDFLEVGTIYSTWFCETLTKLKEVIGKKLSGLLKFGVLLLDENVRLHSATATQNHVVTLGWEHIHHLPDLAPSDFHLLLALTKIIALRRSGCNAEVKQAIKR
ncbi:histone-lysine N-methyltransferase SETMAR [Trichonephila clavipes]|nr:histone-lysine N-methyltransferase SETMAR [Trichonephila clavipes]